MLKKFPEYGRRAPETPTFLETLRRDIQGAIHAGSLQPGDRLPGVRQVASRSGVDHRVAARAYRVLADEGLVEVRPKSGAYVSPTLGRGPIGPAAESWAAEVLFQAWQKGIPRSSLCALLGGMPPAPLRCGCIESNEDHMVALTGEIEENLSLEMVPMFVDPGADETTPPPDGLADVDLVVTSVFHAHYALAVAAAADTPVAVLNLRPEFAAEVGRRLSDGPVTAVIVDPAYAGRGRAFFAATGYRLDARFLSVAEAREANIDEHDAHVLITRAARRRLGLEDYHLVPSPRMVSDESARALCRQVAAVAPRRRARLHLSTPGDGALQPHAVMEAY